MSLSKVLKIYRQKEQTFPQLCKVEKSSFVVATARNYCFSKLAQSCPCLNPWEPICQGKKCFCGLWAT